jgi:hypothetical protein
MTKFKTGQYVCIKGDETRKEFLVTNTFFDTYSTDCTEVEQEYNGTKFRFYLESHVFELADEPEENIKKELSSELH